MNIMTRLAIQQLKANRKRTAITIIGIILSVSMLTALSGFIASFQNTLRLTYISFNGDWHISFFNVTEQQITSIGEDSLTESLYTEETEDGNALRIRLKNPTNKYEDTALKIAGQYKVDDLNISYNKELLAAEGIISGDTTLLALYLFGGLLTLVVLTGSILVISNAFHISATERVRQFGLLKSIGATKWQIRSSVIAEGLILSIIAIPAGIALGFLVEFIALIIANNLLQSMSALNNDLVHFQVVFSTWAVAMAALLSLFTILASAWIPARKISKESALDAIRLTKEVKIRPSKMKTPRYVQALFGFTGVLAHKALKRNSSKYRATVVALVVSMVLYVGGSSFGIYIMRTSDLYYTDNGINSMVAVASQPIDFHKTLLSELSALSGSAVACTYSNQYTLAPETLPPSHPSDEGIDVSKFDTLNLCAVSDEDFADICREANVAKTERDAALPFGILVDSAGVNFDISHDEMIPVDNTGGQKIAIAGVIREIPAQLLGISTSPYKGINIITSERHFQSFLSEEGVCMAAYYTWAADVAVFCASASALIESRIGTDGYRTFDFDMMARMNRDISTLVMIFVYGFISMMSLIAVTSVVATISTSIALRRQEFALLSSVGMTKESLRKMLNFESLFYGLKALLVGIPLSILVSWLLYQAISLRYEFGYSMPVTSLLISAAAVMLLSFCTMRYSHSKLGTTNIVEALKSDIA